MTTITRPATTMSYIEYLRVELLEEIRNGRAYHAYWRTRDLVRAIRHIYRIKADC